MNTLKNIVRFNQIKLLTIKSVKKELIRFLTYDKTGNDETIKKINKSLHTFGIL